MAYRVDPRQIGPSLVDVLRELATVVDEASLAERIHEVRKRIKKARSVLRLVGDAPAEAPLRAAAHALAPARDARAVVETVRQLGDSPSSIRWLEERQLRIERELDAASLVAQAQAALAAVTLGPLEPGFAAVEGGLHRTYRDARRALARADEERTAERLHDFRRRAKNHAHHLQLLAPLWKPVLEATRDEADALAELLGDHHNLHVLEQLLAELPDTEERESLRHAIGRRRPELEVEAFARAAPLFAEKPRALVRRFGLYLR